jgi:PKD repeat protein
LPVDSFIIFYIFGLKLKKNAMKKILFFLTISVVMLHTSCDNNLLNGDGPKPVAGFTFSNADCEAACTVEFTNTSKDATNYFWTFGDNGYSIEENPSYEYKVAGVYDVLLVVKGAGGTDSLTQKITIKEGKNQNPYFISLTIDSVKVDLVSLNATRDDVSNPRSFTLNGSAENNANPSFMLYSEETFIGFTDGLNVRFYDQSTPQQVITYTTLDGTVFSSANDADGIYLFFSKLNYSAEGEVVATFVGKLSNSNGDRINISSGSLKLKFNN